MAQYDHDPFNYIVPISEAPWKRQLEYKGHAFLENWAFSFEVARWLGGGLLRLTGVLIALALLPIWLPFWVLGRLTGGDDDDLPW